MFPCGSGSVLQQIQVCQDMIRGITAFATKKTGEALANVSKNLIKPQPQAVPNTVAPAPRTNSNGPVPHINPVEFNKNLRAWENELSKKSQDTKKLLEKKERERKFEMSQFMDNWMVTLLTILCVS